MNAKGRVLAAAFLAQEIDPTDFGHIDHLGVAYELLQANDFLDATMQYAHGIRAMAERAGHPDKFNATITIAFLSVIAERMLTTTSSCFAGFIKENADLMRKDILNQWYGPQRLQSEVARQVFLMPESHVLDRVCELVPA